MWPASHERKRPSDTKNTFFRPPRRPSKQIRRAPASGGSLLAQKNALFTHCGALISIYGTHPASPSVTKSALLAFDCIILSRYGAPSVCKNVLLTRNNVLFARDGSLPTRDGAPPVSNGSLLAQASALFAHDGALRSRYWPLPPAKAPF